MADVEDMTLEILRGIRMEIGALRNELGTLRTDHGVRFDSLENSLHEVREQIRGIHGVLGAHSVALEVLREGQNRMLAGVLTVVEDQDRRIRKLEHPG